MKLVVEQVKVMGKFTFLIVVSSHVDQQRILAENPLFMGKRMVMALPWKPNFKIALLRSTSTPVWVDLPNLNPALEYFANDILGEVGQVVYATTRSMRSRFSHIRACVLYDLSLELVDHVVLDIEGHREIKVAVKYHTLPGACFVCHERGHIARACPSKKKIVAPTKTLEIE